MMMMMMMMMMMPLSLSFVVVVVVAVGVAVVDHEDEDMEHDHREPWGPSQIRITTTPDIFAKRCSASVVDFFFVSFHFCTTVFEEYVEQADKKQPDRDCGLLNLWFRRSWLFCTAVDSWIDANIWILWGIKIRTHILVLFLCFATRNAMVRPSMFETTSWGNNAT